MALHRWSDCNDSLNALGLAIQQGTHGLIRELSLHLADDGCAAVHAVSRCYYGIQLAIHATSQFGAAQHPMLPTTRLLIRVDGTPLDLVVLQPSDDEAHESLSTHDDDRRSPLTVAASA